MDKVVVYHANCLDGTGAAAAVYKAFGDTAEYIPGVYNEELPDFNDKEVYLVDFSYPKDVIIDLILPACKRLVMIDHHKNAVEEAATVVSNKFELHADISKSGAVLAWEYFHKEEIPLVLLYIQDRDLWKFEMPYTKEITASLYHKNYSYKELLSVRVEDHIHDGTLLVDVMRADCEAAIKYNARNMHIAISDGLMLDVTVVNAPPKLSSEIGNMLSDMYGYGATYSDSAKHRSFSLRSNGCVDVSKIARIYGGNGHPKAAGFKVPRSHPLAQG